MLKKKTSHTLLPFLYRGVGVCVFLLLFSCTDSHTFRLTGTLENLRQADFYIYAIDGSLTDLDTIHVLEGSFEWTIRLEEESTFYLIYPNLNEQVIFARPGDHVRFNGDANQLRAVSIKGNPENEALTRFRQEHVQATPDSLHRAMRAYIEANPDSRVSSYLQRQLTLERSTSSRLRKGQKLPNIILPPDTIGGDTLRLLSTDSAARPVLLYFWATWKSDSRKAAISIREAIRKCEKQPKGKRLQPISISLDFDQRQYGYSLKADTIDYDRRRYPQIWDAPICELLAIQTLPYYILADTSRMVRAIGSDWKKDIQQELDKLISEQTKTTPAIGD